MKILIYGHRGQLGSALCRQLGDGAAGLDVPECDITDRAAVRASLLRIQPRAVVNCAAYTQVDRAEDEPDPCWRVNADAVRSLAEACRDADCRLVQISTDYVFAGITGREHPFTEEDLPEPLGEYAHSKWMGERNAASCPKHLVVRTCGLYGKLADGQPGKSFVEAILRLARERDELRVVDDQVCTPSCTDDVARAIGHLLAVDAQGIYHVVNSGSTTWWAMAREIVSLAGLATRVVPITTAEFGARAPRPAYSVLDTGKYRQTGGPELPDWRAALENYIGERSE